MCVAAALCVRSVSSYAVAQQFTPPLLPGRSVSLVLVRWEGRWRPI